MRLNETELLNFKLKVEKLVHALPKCGECGASALWYDESYHYCDEHRPNPTIHDSEAFPWYKELKEILISLNQQKSINPNVVLVNEEEHYDDFGKAI